jgi:EmrB/QacA subfamily drug resistance transporter
VSAPLRTTSTRSTRPFVVLALMCGVQFMVILDLAVVNVAIPSMQADLGLAQAELQWVVVTYGVTLGGFLLLGGRLADLFGRRRILLGGLTVFSVASLGAGLADGLAQLVTSRAVQGLGAALAGTAALSIVVETFAEGAARTKALGVFAAIGGSAGSVGVIASGLLTDGPGWEWIFLINVPIGVGLIALIATVIPHVGRTDGGAVGPSIDWAGAFTLTAGLMAIVYAINKTIDHGWTSATSLGWFAVGAALLVAGVFVERSVRSPLLPLAMFRRRSLTTAIVIGVFVFGAFFATIFQGTLFMQQGLGYSAMRTGLAWLAATVSSLIIAGAVAPVVVNRFGPGRSIVIGQLIVGAGLLVLARTPSDASYWTDLFPGFLAFGVGLGFSMIAVQVAAFIGVEDSVAGLAGGMVETSREVGGALGTAIVATIAVARTNAVSRSGSSGPVDAMTEGFQRASLVGAGFCAAAAVAAGLLMRRSRHSPTTAAVPVDASVSLIEEPGVTLVAADEH